MQILLKDEAEAKGILYGENCTEGLPLGTRIVTEMVEKYGKPFVDVSIFRGIPQCKIAEINLFVGWFKVQDCSTLLPLSYLGSAEKAYLLTYLADVTQTSLIGLDIVDEMTMSTARDYFARFGKSKYVTIVLTNYIVYARCKGLLEEYFESR